MSGEFNPKRYSLFDCIFKYNIISKLNFAFNNKGVVGSSGSNHKYKIKQAHDDEHKK